MKKNLFILVVFFGVMAVGRSIYATTEVVCDGASSNGALGSGARIAKGRDINYRIKEIEKTGNTVEVTHLSTSSSFAANDTGGASVDKVCVVLKY